MATIICVDGLGGNPKVTFQALMDPFRNAGYRIYLARTDSVKTHEDRIQSVLRAYMDVRSEPGHCGTESIMLMGQSAGASAVYNAAARLKGQPLAGIILLSPAMPRGVPFMTPELRKGIWGRMPRLILGLDIFSTVEEYSMLIEPVARELKDEIIANRQLLPGKEARKLAFLPNKLERYDRPTLHIFGELDRWIATSAQRRLSTRLAQCTERLEQFEVPGSGHLTLASERRDQVIQKILDWINKL